MIARIDYRSKNYLADLNKPLDISLTLKNDTGVNCYFAPPFEASPVVTDSFTGSLESGFPVNFYNVKINPHGNGTHTECRGHIDKGDYFINEVLQEFHFIARIITLTPEVDQEDSYISKNQLQNIVDWPDAVVIRTLPNDSDKETRNYSGTNPPYFQADSLDFLEKAGVRHLLTDLPSVDKEQDDGKLEAHKVFWRDHPFATITELIYVDDSIIDGLYLLNLQVLNIELDASPSRPILYELMGINEEV